jgi:hypothetical protein
MSQGKQSNGKENVPVTACQYADCRVLVSLFLLHLLNLTLVLFSPNIIFMLISGWLPTLQP